MAQLTGRENGLAKEREELQARDVKELMPQIYKESHSNINENSLIFFLTGQAA